ncbi:hypothetical protein [Phormidium sp. CCY1219]|jgi:polyhydroxyalkanoate synthesis regulator phasin|uniref:hypothetical protein n=1 Tax=Phormidium sp. CCY1219 TaxID=2886104 RepID=UPI002D1F76E7|nr:hypothetical protein [Phormidium sp. CCY1219]MEB3826270.1 hypothetical protein [Phormidium sp. CCY1219]
MNPDNLFEFVHTGFRVGVGATASLLESIQDSEKREENLADLQLDSSELTRKWAEKGEMTEREARNFVDTLMNQERSPSEAPSSASSTPSPAAPSRPPEDPQVYQDLQELTAQVAALRMELEMLQQQNPDT